MSNTILWTAVEMDICDPIVIPTDNLDNYKLWDKLKCSNLDSYTLDDLENLAHQARLCVTMDV